MKKTEFKKYLEENDISFEEIDGKIIIGSINGGYVNLSSLKTLPDNVQFNNGGNVYLPSLKTLPDNVQFNNGGNVYLNSLKTLPDNVQFNNGGYVYLQKKKLEINKSYIDRFKIKVSRNKIYLYKRVSHDFKTQEGTKNETLWKVGSTLIHPNWNPTGKECGEGKFHACAKPHWCNAFRSKKDDKFIKIEVNVKDLHEWKNGDYPQKIAFRKGKVIEEIS